MREKTLAEDEDNNYSGRIINVNENKQKSPNKPCFNWFNFNFSDIFSLSKTCLSLTI